MPTQNTVKKKNRLPTHLLLDVPGHRENSHECRGNSLSVQQFIDAHHFSTEGKQFCNAVTAAAQMNDCQLLLSHHYLASMFTQP